MIWHLAVALATVLVTLLLTMSGVAGAPLIAGIAVFSVASRRRPRGLPPAIERAGAIAVAAGVALLTVPVLAFDQPTALPVPADAAGVAARDALWALVLVALTTGAMLAVTLMATWWMARRMGAEHRSAFIASLPGGARLARRLSHNHDLRSDLIIGTHSLRRTIAIIAIIGAVAGHGATPTTTLPEPALVLAMVGQVLLGAWLGARLADTGFEVARQCGAPLVTVIVAFAVAGTAGVAAIRATTTVDATTAWLMVVPAGAFDVVAIAVELAPSGEGGPVTLVAAAHLVRFGILLAAMTAGMAWLQRHDNLDLTDTGASASRRWSADTRRPNVRHSAGAVLFRDRAPLLDASPRILARDTAGSQVMVLLVHRPVYDDWSLPKGAIDQGESAEAAAVREVYEESGWTGRVIAELGVERYHERCEPTTFKHVRFFAVEAVEAHRFEPNAEVDATRWFPISEAARHASRPQDRTILERCELTLRPASTRRRFS